MSSGTPLSLNNDNIRFVFTGANRFHILANNTSNQGVRLFNGWMSVGTMRGQQLWTQCKILSQTMSNRGRSTGLRTFHKRYDPATSAFTKVTNADLQEVILSPDLDIWMEELFRHATYKWKGEVSEHKNNAIKVVWQILVGPTEGPRGEIRVSLGSKWDGTTSELATVNDLEPALEQLWKAARDPGLRSHHAGQPAAPTNDDIVRETARTTLDPATADLDVDMLRSEPSAVRGRERSVEEKTMFVS
ncbi:hypothetical protein LTR17_006621 [Elasticomyces elasticus]|nr:hypothetical protein LTR17_006621 [Elasticomyces elasticus]